VADDPRRLVLADLAGRLAAGVAGQARAYDAAAGQAEGPLRDALRQLARAKHAQMADLTPLARTLGVSAPRVPSAATAGGPPAWGVILGQAFQAERTLEEIGRELAGLTSDPGAKAMVLRLATAAARDGGEVRRLYLRYS